MVKTPAERQREYKARKLAQGRRLDVLLSAEAAAALDALAEARQQPKARVVEEVLIDAAGELTGQSAGRAARTARPADTAANPRKRP